MVPWGLVAVQSWARILAAPFCAGFNFCAVGIACHSLVLPCNALSRDSTGSLLGAVSFVCQGTALVRDLDCCIPGYIFLMCPLFYVFMFSFFSFFLFLQRELCRMTVVV